MDPETDVRVLVLAWKLKSAERPGEVSKKEWLAGMAAMEVDTVKGLKAKLPEVGDRRHGNIARAEGRFAALPRSACDAGGSAPPPCGAGRVPLALSSDGPVAPCSLAAVSRRPAPLRPSFRPVPPSPVKPHRR